MTAFIIVCMSLFALNIVLNVANSNIEVGYRIVGVIINIGLLIWAVTLL